MLENVKNWRSATADVARGWTQWCKGLEKLKKKLKKLKKNWIQLTPTHPHPQSKLFFGNPSLTWTEHSNHNNQQLLAMCTCTDRIHMAYYFKISVHCTCLGLFWDDFPPKKIHPLHSIKSQIFWEQNSLQSPFEGDKVKKLSRRRWRHSPLVVFEHLVVKVLLHIIILFLWTLLLIRHHPISLGKRKQHLIIRAIMVKVCRAASRRLDHSKRFTLSSPDRPVHSDINSASLGSILATQQLHNDYSLTFPPLFIARYSFIQLSRLRLREENENAQTSKR